MAVLPPIRGSQPHKGMCAGTVGVPLSQEEGTGMTVNVCSVTSGWTK